MGLEPDNLTRIFKRFEQVDSSTTRRAGGLGLGLSIARHIIELHGGRIEAQSEGMGHGTSILVSLPISPLKPESENQELPIDDHHHQDPELVRSKKLDGETILIVEDEPDALEFLRLLVVSHGANVYTASNGEEALNEIQRHDHIGLVLSDVGMPIMDGYQFIKNLRSSKDKKLSSITAIALTAFGRPQDRINALNAGFDYYIAKPVMQEELLAVLLRSCQSRKKN